MDRRSIPSHEQIRQVVRVELEQRYARGSANTHPEQVLPQLHAQLVEAARAYETGPKQQRQAVCDAIIAVDEFLAGQGFTGETLAPLKRVVVAITDLCQHNQPDPLFCQKLSKTKGKRTLQDSVRQGQLAALAEAWVESASSEEGDKAALLNKAAREISGRYFGNVERAGLSSAMAYQRQPNHPPLLYEAHAQMKKRLAIEAEAAGGDARGLRAAVLTQLEALNAKAECMSS